jgi:lycopene beta-cyclase
VKSTDIAPVPVSAFKARRRQTAINIPGMSGSTTSSPPAAALDLLFIGGGLASCLAAYRTAQLQPGLRLQILEREPRVLGNHTWSFHDEDIPPSARAWVDPLVTWRWPRYEVRFPSHRRVIEGGYQSIESPQLERVIRATLGDRVRVGTAPDTIAGDHVILPGTGERLEARAVVDATGFRPSPALRLGYQKFLGQVLEFDQPIGLAHPILMDATVEQEDGFRFVYVLPFTEHSALIEDTYYSDSPALSQDQLRARILAYARRAGWRVQRVIREETGVLPITLAGDFARFWPREDRLPRLGLRAGLFHPTTGYALPEAVATAELVAERAPGDGTALAAALRTHAEARWRHGSYYRGLNRMLFLAGRPADRYRVLDRFYRLPAGLIARFYAGRLGVGDRIRLLAGSPPVPVGAAVAALLDTSVGAPGAKVVP